MLAGFCFIDAEILEDVFSMLVCPDCRQASLMLSEEMRYGCATFMNLSCYCYCGWENTFYSSRKTYPQGFDVNKRVVYAMWSCEEGYAGPEIFMTLINLPPPMVRKNYNKLVDTFLDAVKIVAEETMRTVLQNLKTK